VSIVWSSQSSHGHQRVQDPLVCVSVYTRIYSKPFRRKVHIVACAHIRKISLGLRSSRRLPNLWYSLSLSNTHTHTHKHTHTHTYFFSVWLFQTFLSPILSWEVVLQTTTKKIIWKTLLYRIELSSIFNVYFNVRTIFIILKTICFLVILIPLYLRHN